MSKKIPFLLIDEEEKTIDILKNFIVKIFPHSIIYSANEGVYAINFIAKHAGPLIIVSNDNIPGINGYQLLKKVKSEDSLKDCYFILMLKEGDKDQNLKVLQAGADDFLPLPFSVDNLLGKLKIAYNNIMLKYDIDDWKQKNAELEVELLNVKNRMKDVLLKIQQMRMPETAKSLVSIAKAGVWIANQFVEEDDGMRTIKLIEDAASVCFIGRLALTDKNINDSIMINGFVRNDTLAQVPVFAKNLIGGIRGFDEIAGVLYHIYENFDGSGIPEKIKGWEIPLGSRILRVVLDYYDLLSVTKQPSKAIEGLEHEVKRLYDFRIVSIMDQYLAYSGGDKGLGREKTIDRRELVAGMCISRHIYLTSSIKIVAAGTLLDDETIEKIQNITKEDPVIGSIWIKDLK